MRQKTRNIIPIILVTLLIDQITKAIARERLTGEPTIRLLGDTIRLSYHENSGAFLSLGANLDPTLRTLIFTVAVGIFLVIFLIYIIRDEALTGWPLFFTTLLISGGIGNFIDRVINSGAVVDFLNVGIGRLRTGIFNVADMAIMAGLFGVLILMFFEKPIPSDE